MTFCEIIAKFDQPFRKFFVSNFPYLSCFLYSCARKVFLNKIIKENPRQITLPKEYEVKLWDIKFRAPLFNAAGLFKDGDGYFLSYRQGAGAFLAGTVTLSPRVGNSKRGINHPFMPYPRSKASSNWLGLPNKGFELVAKKISELPRFHSFPIGISIASSLETKSTMNQLVEALHLFQKAGVDFIELNESCPNVENHRSYAILDDEFINRLEFISNKFIKKINANIPVIVKLSNDFPAEIIPNLLDILIEQKFSGINFGNTSTNYLQYREFIHHLEQKSFDFFIENFGGGLAGSILKNKSLQLSTKAVEYLSLKNVPYEFRVIRTGGITCFDDFKESFNKGVILHQWFSGYFENFARFGHKLYLKFFENLQ